ncbi:MAG: GNAT family N-acetyltransferase [Candidatus Xenobia bacterium]
MIEVRPIRPQEHDALGQLTLDAYRSLAGGHLSEDYAAELLHVADRARVARVLVAVSPMGEVLGGVTYVPDDHNPLAEFKDPAAAAFRMLAVKPGLHGQGIGQALVQACVEQARREGRARLLLHSTPWMVAAHRLYERLQFQRAPELDWSPLPEVPLLGYRLELL